MVFRVKRFMRPKATRPNLSATFRHGGLLQGGGNVTFDETLALIEREQRRRAMQKQRHAEYPQVSTPAQRKALADNHARMMTQRGKIKMPVVRIQTIDVDKIGA